MSVSTILQACATIARNAAPVRALINHTPKARYYSSGGEKLNLEFFRGSGDSLLVAIAYDSESRVNPMNQVVPLFQDSETTRGPLKITVKGGKMTISFRESCFPKT